MVKCAQTITCWVLHVQVVASQEDEDGSIHKPEAPYDSSHGAPRQQQRAPGAGFVSAIPFPAVRVLLQQKARQQADC